MVTLAHSNPFSTVTIAKTTLPEENPTKQLRYLALFGTTDGLCPFTEEQKNLFTTTDKVIKTAADWLQHGLWGTTLLSVIPVIAFPIVSYVGPVNKWTQEKSVNALYITLILTTISAATNWINFIATGIFPDRSSVAHDTRADQLRKTVAMYENMGSRLIELHQRTRPVTIRLDLTKIQKAMEQWVSTENAKELLHYLETAQEYIESRKLSSNAPLSIRRTVQICTLQKKGRRYHPLLHK